MAHGGAARPSGDVRVLVVDDDQLTRDVLSAFLTMLGYQHDVVSDGHRARAALCTVRYSLALVDIHMPGLTGGELVQAVKREETRGALPIFIAITASPSEERVKSLLEQGVDAVLPKPFFLSTLRDTIEAWL